MIRRNFLKGILPVAALAGTGVSVLGHAGINHRGVRYEVTPGKRYLFVFPSTWITRADVSDIRQALINKGLEDPIIFGGGTTEGMSIYELESRVDTASRVVGPHQDGERG